VNLGWSCVGFGRVLRGGDGVDGVDSLDKRDCFSWVWWDIDWRVSFSRALQ
jgi:hypothetical protein